MNGLIKIKHCLYNMKLYRVWHSLISIVKMTMDVDLEDLWCREILAGEQNSLCRTRVWI